VVIVKDEDEIIWDGRDFVDQRCHNCFGVKRLCGLEHSQNPFSDIRRNCLQHSNEICQEAGWVVISFVQRQPGGRTIAVGEPFADQCCLAKTGRGRYEGEFVAKLKPVLQPL